MTDREEKTPAAAETLEVVGEALRRGLVLMRAGIFSNCIRFLPPLNISDDLIDEGMGVVSDVLRAVEARRQPA